MRPNRITQGCHWTILQGRAENFTDTDRGGFEITILFASLTNTVPHGSNGSISMTATLILYDRSGHKLIED
jgi:hypothetical protein